MKRSEAREGISKLIVKHAACCTPDNLAEFILQYTKEIGMAAPVGTCVLVPDDVRGGTKHGETKREWDPE
jgi:hypothetical protein